MLRRRDHAVRACGCPHPALDFQIGIESGTDRERLAADSRVTRPGGRAVNVEINCVNQQPPPSPLKLEGAHEGAIQITDDVVGVDINTWRPITS